ncbi:MAG TPA: YciI family protein [Stellaceae bacterium]|nr:YciI family protein [Stellaceae bacterium]
MTSNGTYVAVFLGSKSSPRMAQWMALPEAERKAKEQQGMAAWNGWMEQHQAAIVGVGGPLGKTKRVSGTGIEDATNMLSAYTIVRAESHEAAAKLFESHPFFAIFPGEAVEIMPVMPVPGR